MTKGIWAALGMAALLLAQACHPKQAGSSNTAQAAPASDTLASAMDGFLSSYYTLKDAFIRSDTAAADTAAHRLQKDASSLPLQTLKDEKRQDSVVAAVEGLRAELSGLLGETSLSGKRREFAMISDLSWQLIRAAGLKGKTVYRDFCPMFNEGSGAYWLNATDSIRNPYYGSGMPDCGQVADSLRF